MTFALNRIRDGRVRQYWDPDHVVAKRLAADARSPQPEQECCVQSGLLWDLAAVYSKDAVWDDRMPVATVFNGTVVDVASSIEAAVGGPPR